MNSKNGTHPATFGPTTEATAIHSYDPDLDLKLKDVVPLTALPSVPSPSTPPNTRNPSVAPTSASASIWQHFKSTSRATAVTPNRDRTESELTSSRKQTERKLVRKLDWFMFPCFVAMCLFQAADKGAIGIAKINGIQKDLSINQHQFNVALAIFQVGYCVFQVPSNMMIAHPNVHSGVYLSLTCLGWSIVGLCHAFVKNYAQLLTVRLLLGVLDAPCFVGIGYLLSCWYTKKEMAMRLGMLLVLIIMLMVAFGPIAAQILSNVDGVGGMRGWRWIYVVCGSFGVGISGWASAMLPGQASRASGRKIWWLSEEEYEFARTRIEEDRVGEKSVDKNQLWTGFKDAMGDIRTWIFALMMLGRKCFEGLFNYELSILKSLHLFEESDLSETTLALLLSTGPALFAGIVTLATAHSSDRMSERTWHLTVPLLFAGTALIVSAATLDSVTRYVMVFLWEAGGVSGFALTWAWVTSTVQETAEKRAVAIAIVNVLGGFGAIYGPFFFPGEDAPGYRMAFGLLAGHVVMDMGCVFWMRWLLKRANRSLEEKAMDKGKQTEVKSYML